RRRHTRSKRDWSSDVCSSDLGFERAQEEAWDCIILDWMLPNMDGITICQKLRQAGIDLPIIMLTAKDSESDQVLGLEIGADDYRSEERRGGEESGSWCGMVER